jgi:glycosyltransferase involved in cell wall biosynthesis
VGTLLQLPFHRVAALGRLNGVLGAWTVRRALRRARMDRPIVWCTVPHALPVIERVEGALIVYYCIDEYSALPGVDRAAVQALDDRLARRADLIIAASGPVYERHRRTNRAIRLIPHGVDLTHFARPAQPYSRPDELKDIEGPIVGFVGSIEGRIDLPLIEWLARQLPHLTFVMIGSVAVPANELCTAPNVRFLGARPYALLPQYAQHFDVAIIPYRQMPVVLAANPLKLREYLGMGLPVVSVSTPEIERYRDVVSIAHTREQFVDALKQALSTGSNLSAQRARVAAVEGDAWEARVAEMVAAMDDVLSQRTGGTAA